MSERNAALAYAAFEDRNLEAAAAYKALQATADDEVTTLRAPARAGRAYLRLWRGQRTGNDPYSGK